MDIIKCDDKDINELYDNWALAFEGTTTDIDNLNWLINWFKIHNCEMLRENFYTISGKQMNEKYNLTGDNSYLDNLTIVCIKQEDLSNVSEIIMSRFEIGGRWFTDIVDNNLEREN